MVVTMVTMETLSAMEQTLLCVASLFFLTRPSSHFVACEVKKGRRAVAKLSCG